MRVERNAQALSGVNITLPASVPRIDLSTNALFQLRPSTAGKPSSYLVETDPEFTLQRQWLGSDYMLTQLGYDPATVTQRLGDGFYEQKLVREQVAQLTGRRFLGTFTDDEAQYRALLDAGTAFGQAYQLKPGIALSPAQMALLTSDIVWLVAREVVMPDGSVQRVLTPQLYALVDSSTGSLTSGLISAKGVNINLTSGLFNSGTLAARENLSINAQSITNVLGQMQGNNVDLRASGGITSILGQIKARQNLTMSAGENMVFVGGGIKAGGNARLSAGGDLLLLAYDTGKQLRGAPMTPIRFFLDKGHLTNRGADTLGLTGVGILWVTVYLFDEWSGFWFWFFLLLGGVLGYIGAYGGLAKRFGFSAPFTNDPVGWRAAKKSYDEPESKEDDINNQQLAKQLQDKVNAAQRRFDVNPTDQNTGNSDKAEEFLNNSRRDGEVLITPNVPPTYYSKPTGPVTPIAPVPKVPSKPTTPAQPIK